VCIPADPGVSQVCCVDVKQSEFSILASLLVAASPRDCFAQVYRLHDLHQGLCIIVGEPARVLDDGALYFWRNELPFRAERESIINSGRTHCLEDLGLPPRIPRKPSLDIPEGRLWCIELLLFYSHEQLAETTTAEDKFWIVREAANGKSGNIYTKSARTSQAGALVVYNLTRANMDEIKMELRNFPFPLFFVDEFVFVDPSGSIVGRTPAIAGSDNLKSLSDLLTSLLTTAFPVVD